MSGSPVVVKLGGTTIIEQQDVLREIVEERASRPVVVVHGGGKRLTEWLERLGVESHWDQGRRLPSGESRLSRGVVAPEARNSMPSCPASVSASASSVSSAACMARNSDCSPRANPWP